MASIDYEKWSQDALAGKEISHEDAKLILSDPSVDLLRLVTVAGDVRMATFGKKVKLHQINNIQNGLCPEDCGYCGQAKGADAPLQKYRMKGEDAIVEEAKDAKARGVYRYCMVASGRGPNDKMTDQLANTIRRITDEVGIKTCLSVGLVDEAKAKKFKDAGLDRLNHNLNTSEAHTPNIVNTHTYEDRIQTIQAARSAGLGNCSGIIVGMGEEDQDIIDVAFELRQLEVPSIPVNFLIPIEGNRIFSFGQLTPERCVRILCLFRLINPKAELRMAGGREGHLRTLQNLALYPANSLFVEGYLVTRGDQQRKTIQMIKEAGFEIDGKEPDYTTEDNAFQVDDNPSILNPKTTVVNNEQQAVNAG